MASEKCEANKGKEGGDGWFFIRPTSMMNWGPFLLHGPFKLFFFSFHRLLSGSVSFPLHCLLNFFTGEASHAFFLSLIFPGNSSHVLESLLPVGRNTQRRLKEMLVEPEM